MNIPFNLATKFSSDLKERAVDVEQFVIAKQFLQDELTFKENLDDHGKRDRLSLLGYICRILGQNEEALERATEALNISKKTNMVLLVVIDQMRVASCHQALGDLDTAKALFTETIQICEKFKPLNEIIDFAYHNYARFLYEQGDFNESKVYFEKALNVREEKGNEELLEATKFALNATQNKLEKH